MKKSETSRVLSPIAAESACTRKTASRGGLLSTEAWNTVGASLKLSPRELEISRCILADQTEAAIALTLGISANTVRTHTERLYRKLGVQSRVELLVRIITHFLSLTANPDCDLPPICSNRAVGRCPLSN